MVESDDSRRDVDIFSRSGAPVVAVNDGRIEKIGHSERLGLYVRLQDVYGNRYTYAHLGSLAKVHPVPRESLKDAARALRAHRAGGPPSHGGRLGRAPGSAAAASGRCASARAPRCPSRSGCSPIPAPRAPSSSAGMEQMLDAKARRNGDYETYANYFARPYGIDPREVRLERLRKGSRVIGGTILGRVGATLPGQGAARLVLDPAGRPRSAAHRPQADPRRLEAARGDRRLPRLGPQRPAPRRRPLDRAGADDAQAAARAARPGRRPHRDLRLRP